MSAAHPNQDRRAWTVRLLWASLVLAAVDLLVQVQAITAIGQARPEIERGQLSDGVRASLAFSDRLTGAVGVLQLVVAVATAITFLLWWHRSLVNLREGGQPVAVTPGWAVGMWFVPLVCLYRPYQIMVEAATRPDGVRARRLGAWWALWLTSSLLTNLASRVGARATTLDTLNSVAVMYLIADVATIFAARLLMDIVAFVQDRQDRLGLPIESTSYSAAKVL